MPGMHGAHLTAQKVKSVRRASAALRSGDLPPKLQEQRKRGQSSESFNTRAMPWSSADDLPSVPVRGDEHARSPDQAPWHPWCRPPPFPSAPHWAGHARSPCPACAMGT